MAGRRRDSVETHIARGTYKPHVHGTIDTEKIFVGPELADKPPPELNKWGMAVWKRLYESLKTQGIVTENERELFTSFCEAAGRWYEAVAGLKKTGTLVVVKAKKRKAASSSFDLDGPEEDTLTRSPWLAVKREAFVDMMRAAKELGLTSVDRIKVARVKTKDERKPETVPNRRPKTALEKLTEGGG